MIRLTLHAEIRVFYLLFHFRRRQGGSRPRSLRCGSGSISGAGDPSPAAALEGEQGAVGFCRTPHSLPRLLPSPRKTIRSPAWLSFRARATLIQAPGSSWARLQAGEVGRDGWPVLEGSWVRAGGLPVTVGMGRGPLLPLRLPGWTPRALRAGVGCAASSGEQTLGASRAAEQKGGEGGIVCEADGSEQRRGGSLPACLSVVCLSVFLRSQQQQRECRRHLCVVTAWKTSTGHIRGCRGHSQWDSFFPRL